MPQINAYQAKELLTKHPGLIHSENKKVLSHQQREVDQWFLNTLMLADCDIPFRFKRKKRYQNLKGASVNLTYYPDHENLAGMPFEIMKVVRIRRA